MNTRLWIKSVMGSIVVGWAVMAGSQEPAAAPSANESVANRATARDSVTRARDQAKLMHKVYAATLEVMHDRYFHKDLDTVPARALEDVFTEMKRQVKIDARWIGVNAKTMSINHEPKDDFEQFAAKSLGKGEETVERIEANVYRRAEAIRLSANCLTCHGALGVEPKTPRVAGLVISIPLKD